MVAADEGAMVGGFAAISCMPSQLNHGVRRAAAGWLCVRIATEAPMSKVEEIERDVRQRSEQELATFRAWFSEYDAARWDEQFEADAQGGRLDAVADAALTDHAAGRSRPL